MKRLLILVSLIAVLAILAVGAASAAPSHTPPLTTATLAQATATPAATQAMNAGADEASARAAGLTFLADAYAGKYKGQTVTMTGPQTTEDEVKMNNNFADFTKATGITIQFVGTKEFEANIGTRLAAGDAPDIIDFPQPGLLATFVKQGKIVDAAKLVPEAWLKQNYLQSWLDMSTMVGPDGKAAQGGVWHRFAAKSLVWYPKKAFDAAGYKVPTTWAELTALTDQIVKDGDAAWCIGIESGAATGWPATDWTEDLMLRTTSLENYDKWVQGTLKFASPEVKKAIETFGSIWTNDADVLGGRKSIATTFFGNAPIPMFDNPPKCWLHRQANFITSFFPKDKNLQFGVDYDFFYLPVVDDQHGKPVLVSGDLLAATNDKPATQAVMQYSATGEGVHSFLAAGGALSPHNDADLKWYGDPVEAKVAEMVKGATAVRFDGSDLMPGAVGSGSFWKGMTDWITGTKDLDTVLKEIDAAWPAPAQ